MEPGLEQRLDTGKQRGYLHLALCSGGCWSPLESLDWILLEDQIQIYQGFSTLLQLISTLVVFRCTLTY